MDLIFSVEKARRLRGMSQSAIAEALAVTQGHYSKVVRDQVPLSKKLSARMEAWLAKNGAPPLGNDVTRRIRKLAGSIRRDCQALLDLVENGSEVDA